MITYAISVRDPHAHLFRVSCRVAVPDPAGQAFRLPAWIPGSYLVREFARHVVEAWAECEGQPVACDKTDKATWQCEPVQGELTFNWDVYAWDLSVRGAFLDAGRGYFNGPCVFPAVVGREQEPCSVTLAAPAHATGWQVATTLPVLQVDARGFGDYRAADYATLIDHPVEMGCFTRLTFTARGVPHEVVISGVHRVDGERLVRDLERICSAHIDLFGGTAPFSRYLFQVMVTADGYGGLEHADCTSLIAARDDLPQPGEAADALREGYRSFLGLCSHEYFHAWNVKRIRPLAVARNDLSGEAYTSLLWAFEGITSYYDDLMLVRAGVITPASWLELTGRMITRVLRSPGRALQSVAESSFDAWIKFYRQDENAPNAQVSYYAKGALVALGLDMELRRLSGGTRSLDDVMRLLWQRYGRSDEGVPEDGIELAAAEVAGVPLADFFADYVHGLAELPLADWLAPMDVEVGLRAAESAADKGGTPGKGAAPARPWAGAQTVQDALGARVQFCFADGPAMRAGMSAGDVIVAIDGLRATHANLDKLLQFRTPGEAVEVHAFRRDELRVSRVLLAPAPADTCWLSFRGGRPSPAALAWLCGRED